MSDKLSREVGKAYRVSARCEIDKLLRERSRWMRKLTIAQNKLLGVNQEIAVKAVDWAVALDKERDK